MKNYHARSVSTTDLDKLEKEKSRAAQKHFVLKSYRKRTPKFKAARQRPASAQPRRSEDGHIGKGQFYENLTDKESEFLVKGKRSRSENHLKRLQGCFDVFPGSIEMGEIKLHSSKTMRIQCKNLGANLERLRIGSISDIRIKVSYNDNTSVAPGMTSMIGITIEGTQSGEVDGFITIKAGKEQYQIPVNGCIKDQHMKQESRADSDYEPDIIKLIPRLPNTHYNMELGVLVCERSNQYEFDQTVTVEEIKRRDRERSKRLYELPLAPRCKRFSEETRACDHEIDKIEQWQVKSVHTWLENQTMD